MKKITEIITLPKFHRNACLYTCRYCGEKVLLPAQPGACPSCGRRQTDKVTDLDTGIVSGGEPVMQRASKAEQAVYFAMKNRKKQERKKLMSGNTIVVVMRDGE